MSAPFPKQVSVTHYAVPVAKQTIDPDSAPQPKAFEHSKAGLPEGLRWFASLTRLSWGCNEGQGMISRSSKVRGDTGL